MNLVAIAMLGAGLSPGQPTPDYYPMTTRNLKLVIAYTPEEKKNIRQVQLFASQDQGQTWTLEATVTPDKDFFPYIAKADGVYWFNMVVVYNDGTKDPPDITKAASPQKLLVDATPPVVRVAAATRAGDEIAVDWSIEDKFPNPAKTKLAYRLATGTEADWKDVPLPAADARSVRFNPNTNASLIVRVTAEDLAGNSQTLIREVGGVTTSGFLAPADTGNLTPPVTPTSLPGGPIAPPNLDPVVPPPVISSGPTAPPAAPAPVVDLTTPPPSAPAPIAVGSGTGTQPMPTTPPITPATATQPELPPAQVVNYARFDLPYQVEAGPSGIRHVDLFVTRDDGRSWHKWSQHDGKELPLKVNLESRTETRPDGTYGFRLIPVSGAGLADEPPRPGTPPELRIQVDTIAPVIYIYPPEPDPTNRDVLALRWSITDKNLGKDPVALEWGEGPTGPWRSVVGSEALAPVAVGQTPAGPPRIANTGRYAWRIPANLPSHLVYLKVTAWDAAGNKSEIATDKPILVDLTKPRARIQGIQATATRP